MNKEHRWVKTLDCISVKLEESGQGILQICYVASNNLSIKSVSFFSNLTSTLMLRCPFKHTLRLLLNFSLLFHEVLTPVYNWHRIWGVRNSLMLSPLLRKSSTNSVLSSSRAASMGSLRLSVYIQQNKETATLSNRLMLLSLFPFRKRSIPPLLTKP